MKKFGVWKTSFPFIIRPVSTVAGAYEPQILSCIVATFIQEEYRKSDMFVCPNDDKEYDMFYDVPGLGRLKPGKKFLTNLEMWTLSWSDEAIKNEVRNIKNRWIEDWEKYATIDEYANNIVGVEIYANLFDGFLQNRLEQDFQLLNVRVGASEGGEKFIFLTSAGENLKLQKDSVFLSLASYKQNINVFDTTSKLDSRMITE
jgi:hypothetical protein